jgi:cytochrome c
MAGRFIEDQGCIDFPYLERLMIAFTYRYRTCSTLGFVLFGIRATSIAAVAFVGVLLAMPTAPAQAAGDAAAGKQLFESRCVGCHGDDKTTVTLGPNLVGIVGRKAGTGESGVHSRALTASDITWTSASLRWFLAAPAKQVPGTTMPVGIPSAREIDDLVAYLETLR